MTFSEEYPTTHEGQQRTSNPIEILLGLVVIQVGSPEPSSNLKVLHAVIWGTYETLEGLTPAQAAGLIDVPLRLKDLAQIA